MALVRYRELQCKSVINRVHGMPFKWSINPYRGCAHSCHYCYARGTHTYLDLGVGDDFSGIIFAKVNAAEVLRVELARRSWRRECISIGSATDPYQPAEGRFKITQGILRVLHEHHNPVSIVTKGTLILRDRELLAAMAERAGCTVCFSVPTVDSAIWQASEPGTAPPLQRLRVMKLLAAAGVHVGVLAAPIIPGLSSTPEQLEATVRAASEHGARFFWAGLLHIGQLEREHFMRFLNHEYPNLVTLHTRMYSGKYPPRAAAQVLSNQVAELKQAYGLIDIHQPIQQPEQLKLVYA
jgi:DNA repair photolyase